MSRRDPKYIVEAGERSDPVRLVIGGGASDPIDIVDSSVRADPIRIVTNASERSDPVNISYAQRVLLTNPVAYWPLWEAAGGTAECLVNPLQNGAYTGVTLGQPGIGDGNTAPYFDGINDVVNIYTPALKTLLDGAVGSEGSVIVWWKVSNAAVWTDGTFRVVIDIKQADGQNRFAIYKTDNNNEIQWRYIAGVVSKSIIRGGESSLDWMCTGLTWSASADEVKAYFTGTQEGTTQTGLGVWGGGIATNFMTIGAYNTVPAFIMLGSMAHVAIFPLALTGPEMTDLAVV